MQTVILCVAFKKRDEGSVKLVAWLFSEGRFKWLFFFSVKKVSPSCKPRKGKI
jgi:hypothetical protein